MVIFADKHVHRQKLSEWVTTQLKCTIDVPTLCSLEVLKLCICGKYQMAPFADSNISLQEFCWNVVILNVKSKICGILRSLALS